MCNHLHLYTASARKSKAPSAKKSAPVCSSTQHTTPAYLQPLHIVCGGISAVWAKRPAQVDTVFGCGLVFLAMTALVIVMAGFYLCGEFVVGFLQDTWPGRVLQSFFDGVIAVATSFSNCEMSLSAKFATTDGCGLTLETDSNKIKELKIFENHQAYVQWARAVVCKTADEVRRSIYCDPCDTADKYCNKEAPELCGMVHAKLLERQGLACAWKAPLMSFFWIAFIVIVVALFCIVVYRWRAASTVTSKGIPMTSRGTKCTKCRLVNGTLHSCCTAHMS